MRKLHRDSIFHSTRARLIATIALLLTLVATAPAAGIVTMNPASADPATDPHIVDGPVDIDDFVTEYTFDYPPIQPDGIVQIEIIRQPQQPDGKCSASVINTPAGRAILTAAHCVNFFHLKQVKATIPVFGVPTVFETCHEVNDPGCDLDAHVLIHPQYGNSVTRGYDLALIFFDDPLGLGIRAYSIAAADVVTDGWNAMVKFGFGCYGYNGTGVDECDLANYDDQLRWAMNIWDSESLGAFGVTVNGQNFSNFSTQLVYDNDNYSDYDHNLYNFYGPTFHPKTAYREHYFWCFGPCGILGAEGSGCAGDSGGPNFVYDTANSTWVIRAVNSYAFRMDDGWNGFVGNSDLDGPFLGCGGTGRNLTAGEFGGDALVTPQMIDDILANPRQLPTSGLFSNTGGQHGLGLSPSSQGSSSLER